MSGLEESLTPREDHHNDAAASRASSQLTWAMIFCFVFMIAEVIGGYYAKSLAIMTECVPLALPPPPALKARPRAAASLPPFPPLRPASSRSAAHLLSDVLAFLISLFAIWIAKRPAAGALTWGSHRYEMVGAVLSVFLIWVLTVVLCMEAVDRFLHPEPVDGQIMFITALMGLLVNLAMMRILHQDLGGGHGGHSHSHGGHSHGSHENLNVSAAFIHVVGDLVQSIGVMIAAVIIWVAPSLTVVDPICTFLFSILVVFTTLGVMRSALTSALSSAPAHVSLPSLTRELLALPNVKTLYGLHVWEYGGVGDKSRVAMEAHLVCSERLQLAGVLEDALAVAARHGVTHPTLQVEPLGSKGGVVDAAGATLEVYEVGAEPRGTILADLVFHITGMRLCGQGSRAAASLYRLAPPRASLGVQEGGCGSGEEAAASISACSGHGHSHGGGGGGAASRLTHGHSHGGGAPPSASASFGGGNSHSHPALSLSFP